MSNDVLSESSFYVNHVFVKFKQILSIITLLLFIIGQLEHFPYLFNKTIVTKVSNLSKQKFYKKYNQSRITNAVRKIS